MKKALIQLHIAVMLAGFTAILGKLINLNEILLVWYRLFITVASLLVLLLLKKEFKRLLLKDTLGIFCVGVIVAIHWVAFYGSIKYANVSVALVCFSATGFFTAFFEPLIINRKIKIIEVVLGMLAIAGIYIIFDFYPQFKTGIIFGLIAAVGSSLFPIYNKKLVTKFSPRIVTLYELTGGLIALSIFMPLYLMKFPANHYLPGISDWVYLLILAWLCTIISFDLQLKSLRKLSAFTSNLTYNLEPVYGIILAFIIFKENREFSFHFYLGLTLIILAVIMQMYRVKKFRA